MCFLADLFPSSCALGKRLRCGQWASASLSASSRRAAAAAPTAAAQGRSAHRFFATQRTAAPTNPEPSPLRCLARNLRSEARARMAQFRICASRTLFSAARKASQQHGPLASAGARLAYGARPGSHCSRERHREPWIRTLHNQDQPGRKVCGHRLVRWELWRRRTIAEGRLSTDRRPPTPPGSRHPSPGA